MDARSFSESSSQSGVYSSKRPETDMVFLSCRHVQCSMIVPQPEHEVQVPLEELLDDLTALHLDEEEEFAVQCLGCRSGC